MVDVHSSESCLGPGQGSSGSSRTSRLTSACSDAFAFNQFGFDGKTSFDAERELMKNRSEHFLIKEKESIDDIWKRPPPDFRLQMFAPKPPKRNSREAMQPWKYGTLPGQKPVKREKENEKTAPSFLSSRILFSPFVLLRKFVSNAHKVEQSSV